MTVRPYSATLQAAYRDTLGTPGAPEVIDDSAPVIPVAVVAQVNTASTSAFVKVTDGTDTLSIESDGSLTPTKKTATLAATSINGAGTATIGTVPANKVWRILSLYMAGCMNGASNVFARVEFNAVTALRLKFQSSAGTYTFGSESLMWNYTACPVLTAGQTATVINDAAGMETSAGITYVEESV